MNAFLIRLAFAGIRARLLASTLTILIAAAIAATVVIALEVGATGRDPWQRTFNAAHGADVLALVRTEADASAIGALPQVSQASGPVPWTLANLSSVDDHIGVGLTGLDGIPKVNMPVLTAGTMPSAGTIVLEQSLARALGLRVGGDVELHAQAGEVRLKIAGTAVLPSQPRFPRSKPGLAWVTISDLHQVQPDRSTWRWSQAVRLRDPGAAGSFMASIARDLRPGTAAVITKDQQRADALLDAQPAVLIVSAYALVLLAVAFAIAVILVGTRAREQYREIGLLKAIGLTPRQVGRVFAIESSALGLIGVVVGFVVGAMLAPILATSVADTMVAAPTTAANPWHALIAACPVLVVLVSGTWVSTLRQSRMPIINAINAGTAAPANRSVIARAITRLGDNPTVDLGLRNLLAERSRAVMLAAALTVTGAALVFALSVQASLDAVPDGQVSDVPDGLALLVYSLDVVLLLIATLSLVAVALLSVRERMREFSVLKTLGFTPGQITVSLTSGHALLALASGLLSIPVGMALYAAVYAAAGGPSEGRVFAGPMSLALVVLGLIVLVIFAISLPAQLAARVDIADGLRYE
jgi:putative ABC transport system permease protein